MFGFNKKQMEGGMMSALSGEISGPRLQKLKPQVSRKRATIIQHAL
jgi:hypothetical protein